MNVETPDLTLDQALALIPGATRSKGYLAGTDAWVKFNPYHVPAGSPEGGEFTSAPGAAGPPILQGVDFEGNRWRMIEQFRTTDEARAAARAYYETMPLLHATSAAVVPDILRHGLQAQSELVDEKADLLDRLREQVEVLPVEDTRWAHRQRREILDQMTRLDASVRAGDLDTARERAETIQHMFDDLGTDLPESLDGLLEAIKGTTFHADAVLGLDQFVFATHGPGRPMASGEYGRVFLVLDPALATAPGTVVTDADIVSIAAAYGHVGWSTPGGTFSPEVVRAYRQRMVQGQGYLDVVASKDAWGKGKFRESWEVKIPHRVDPKAILGVLTLDPDDYIALRDAGVPERLLHYLPGDAPNLLRKAEMRLQFLQTHGGWPEAQDGHYTSEAGD